MLDAFTCFEKRRLANGQQTNICHINKLVLKKNILWHFKEENAVIEVISLVGDIRGQHVGEVGAQE